MVPQDDFQRKIDSLLAVQAFHAQRIQALIRAAELQRTNLDHLDETVADLAESVAQSHSEMVERQGEMVERQGEMVERQKYFDERIDRLVIAIGEFVRKQN
jgi:t-SNARE complex subunit (syntaxin)